MTTQRDANIIAWQANPCQKDIDALHVKFKDVEQFDREVSSLGGAELYLFHRE
jgi:hypothetical protein